MTADSRDDMPRDLAAAALPPDLHAGLAALRRDVAPGRDLWPAIAAGLAHPAVQANARDANVASGGTPPGTSAATGFPGPGTGARAHSGIGKGRGHARQRVPARLLPHAFAASLLVAVAVAWQLAPRVTPDASAIAAAAGQDAPLLRVADAMTREYLGALREVDASRTADTPPGAAGDVLAELDRSAGEVRAALRHDPDAVFLVQRLQRIYARRLALARRSA